MRAGSPTGGRTPARRPSLVKNVHFRDLEKDGEMTFDYVLRDGVVETTNALEVLRRAGVPIAS